MLSFHRKIKMWNIREFSEHKWNYKHVGYKWAKGLLFSHQHQLDGSWPLKSKVSACLFGSVVFGTCTFVCSTSLAPFFFFILTVKLCDKLMQMICRGGSADMFGPCCYISPLIWSDALACWSVLSWKTAVAFSETFSHDQDLSLSHRRLTRSKSRWPTNQPLIL